MGISYRDAIFIELVILGIWTLLLSHKSFVTVPAVPIETLGHD